MADQRFNLLAGTLKLAENSAASAKLNDGKIIAAGNAIELLHGSNPVLVNAGGKIRNLDGTSCGVKVVSAANQTITYEYANNLISVKSNKVTYDYEVTDNEFNINTAAIAEDSFGVTGTLVLITGSDDADKISPVDELGSLLTVEAKAGNDHVTFNRRGKHALITLGDGDDTLNIGQGAIATL